MPKSTSSNTIAFKDKQASFLFMRKKAGLNKIQIIQSTEEFLESGAKIQKVKKKKGLKRTDSKYGLSFD